MAVLVLSIGSIAALRAADQSRLAIGGAADRLIAQIAARNRAEELRLVPPGERAALPGTVTIGGQAIDIDTTTKTTAAGLVEATVTARSARGGGAIFVLYLPVEPPA
ncbi:hypothetical protein BOO69_00655 [Sulfitobacter alexandrii]|uniref:Uncharacterized protein n=1 Tax=Sulfitobacter alexandrii TaxID=1917485 RepID=A0A1J0WCP7_9RHOB|nr:hypothetical protein BOO69_00655 [Sulfitobacter alexandrii]